MISTLYGQLPLVIYPVPELPVTPGGRAVLCKVRGELLGHQLNVQVTLDVNSGELLLMSPDRMIGAFRLGDLVAAHLDRQRQQAAEERRLALEGPHAATH